MTLPAGLAHKSDSDAVFTESVRPFFAEHCSGCHNADQKAGGMSLEAYQKAADVSKNREVWEEVLLRLQTGQMPPKGMPRPDKAAVAAVTR